MFDIIFGAVNALYVAGTIIGSFILLPDDYYNLHKTPEERDMVTVVSFHRQWYKDDSECKFTGLLVPYVRDWPETIKHGDQEEVIPPNLDDTAGHAVIVDKKICPGKPVESVFLVEDVQRNSGRIVKNSSFHFFDPDEQRPEFRPKWMPQVLQRLQRASDTDADAKDMLTTLTALQQNRAEKAKEAATASVTAEASAPVASASEPVAANSSREGHASTPALTIAPGTAQSQPD